MTKRIVRQLNELHQQSLVFLGEHITASEDRALVLVVGAYLDDQLRKLLARFCIEDSNATDEILERALNNFAARIDCAYCLGLISNEVKSDLHRLRTIRNIAAHTFGPMSFDNPDITTLCRTLVLPSLAIPLVKSNPPPKEWFQVTCMLLASYILQKDAEIAALPRRVVPDDTPRYQTVTEENTVFDDEDEGA